MVHSGGHCGGWNYTFYELVLIGKLLQSYVSEKTCTLRYLNIH